VGGPGGEGWLPRTEKSDIALTTTDNPLSRPSERERRKSHARLSGQSIQPREGEVARGTGRNRSVLWPKREAAKIILPVFPHLGYGI
jgi:hypothetical protein